MRRGLYGGKAAGRDFRKHVRSCMPHLNFICCLADPCIWIWPANNSDGNEFYEHVLLHTYDALLASENSKSILRDELGKHFDLKQESIGRPKFYFGSPVRKVMISSDVVVEHWPLMRR